MRDSKFAVCISLFLTIVLLTSCSSVAASPTTKTITILEMELTENYDVSDPFINAKLFCVTENIDTLNMTISFQMEGESGIMEIADNETKEILWSDKWSGNIETNTFTVTLDSLDKDKDYVVQFTGTKIKYAKIAVASENSLVEYLERPRAK